MVEHVVLGCERYEGSRIDVMQVILIEVGHASEEDGKGINTAKIVLRHE